MRAHAAAVLAVVITAGCMPIDDSNPNPTGAPDAGNDGATSTAAHDCAYFSGNGPTVYNGQNGLDETYASHVDAAGTGGLRVNFRIDGNATWTPALLAQYDAYMATAKEHGLDVLGVVLYESLPGTQADWNTGYDETGYSPYVQSFVDTAKLLFNRYGDQVKYWEIWNEPNAWTNASYATDPANAGGTYILPLVYSKMLAETFAQNDSTIVAKGLHLVSGGLFAHDIGGSFSNASDYATAVFDAGPWDWMQSNYGRRYPWDGFGYHIYIDQGGATSAGHILAYVDAIQTAKTNYTDSTQLWITEYGWSTKSVTEAIQASNIDIALGAFESRGDVARTFVFKVDDYDGWGLFNGDWTNKASVTMLQNQDTGCVHLPKTKGLIPGTCTHDVCTAGAALGQACDPCTMVVCAYDPYCCDTYWGLSCFPDVQKYCGQTCP